LKATIGKWGNSLALRIPQGLAQDAQLADGTEVDLRVEDGSLVVGRVDDLNALLARVRPDNIHGDAFPAVALGNELL
jgi:antitoxin MazE